LRKNVTLAITIQFNQSSAFGTDYKSNVTGLPLFSQEY
jgi:hypothetical protein